jgi:hypothetical protein
MLSASGLHSQMGEWPTFSKRTVHTARATLRRLNLRRATAIERFPTRPDAKP